MKKPLQYILLFLACMFRACMSVMAQTDTTTTLPAGSTAFTPSWRWQDFGGKQMLWEYNSAKGKYYLTPTVQWTRGQLATKADSVPLYGTVLPGLRIKPLDTWDRLLDKFNPGSIVSQNGFSKTAGATAIAKGTQATLITAPYATDYVTSPRRFGYGKIRVLLKQSADKPMITWGSAGTYFYLSQTAGVATFGASTGGTLTPIGTFNIPFVTDTWVEISYNGQTAGKVLSVKTWDITSNYPTANAYSYTFTGSELAVTGDQVFLRTLDTTPTTFGALDIQDDASILRNKATFTGDWFPFNRTNRIYLGTITQGSYFDFNIDNATQAQLRIFSDSRATYQPQLSVSIDGGALNLVTYSTTGDILQTVASGLDPTKRHHIQVFLKGLHESDDVWYSQIGFAVRDIVSDGNITPYRDYTGLIEGNGDSITEGLLVYGYASPGPISKPSQSAGALTYLQLLGQKLKLRVRQHGFGGTGINTLNNIPGNGNVPKAIINTASFADGYPKFNIEQPDYVLFNMGTNDASPTLDTAYINGYLALIQATQLKYPKSKIFIVQSLFQSHVASNISVASATSVTYIPTSGISGVTYVDGIHPDVNGHAVFANGLYNLMIPYLTSSSQWTNAPGGIYYNSTGAVGVGTNNFFVRNSNGGAIVNQLFKTSAAGQSIGLGNSSAGSAIFYSNVNSGGQDISFSAIGGYPSNNTAGSEAGYLSLFTQTSGALLEKLRISETGRFTFSTSVSGVVSEKVRIEDTGQILSSAPVGVTALQVGNASFSYGTTPQIKINGFGSTAGGIQLGDGTGVVKYDIARWGDNNLHIESTGSFANTNIVLKGNTAINTASTLIPTTPVGTAAITIGANANNYGSGTAPLRLLGYSANNYGMLEMGDGGGSAVYLAMGRWADNNLHIMSSGTATAGIYVNPKTDLFVAGAGTTTKVNIGTPGTSGGAVTVAGQTSGVVTLATQAVAGTYNFNLPTTAGTAGQVLTSQGGAAAAMTWTSASTGTVTSFGKVDGYGITSSITNPTTTPVHTIAVDSATLFVTLARRNANNTMTGNNVFTKYVELPGAVVIKPVNGASVGVGNASISVSTNAPNTFNFIAPNSGATSLDLSNTADATRIARLSDVTGNARTPVVVSANATMTLNADYLNTTATQYTLTLPPTTGFAIDGSKIITVLATGTGGVKISVPSGYSMTSPGGAATTTGTGGTTITQNQKIQLIPVGTNTYQLQPLNGTVTVFFIQPIDILTFDPVYETITQSSLVF